MDYRQQSYRLPPVIHNSLQQRSMAQYLKCAGETEKTEYESTRLFLLDLRLAISGQLAVAILVLR